MIRYADDKDFELLSKYDRHICETELRNCIKANRVFIMFLNDTFIGWLRFFTAARRTIRNYPVKKFIPPISYKISGICFS